MTYISGTTFSRFTSTHHAVQGEQTGAISSRHGKPLEQTTSTQADSPHSASSSSTYTNPAQDAERGHTVISSKSSVNNPANSPSDNPASSFESMGAVKALVKRYERAGDVDAKTHRSSDGKLFELSLKTKDGDMVTLSIGADFLLGGEGGTTSLAPGSKVFVCRRGRAER